MEEPHFEFALAGKPQAKEATRLMELLDGELQKHLTPDLSPAERKARVMEVVSGDPRLNAMAIRLDELLAGGSSASEKPDS